MDDQSPPPSPDFAELRSFGEYTSGLILLTLFGIFLLLLICCARSLRRTPRQWQVGPGFGGRGVTAGRHGLGAAVLASLPIVAFSSAGAEDEQTAAECSICLVDFAVGEKVRSLPACGHRFHVECVDAWFLSNDTCPICRSIVSASAAAAPLPVVQPQRNLIPARPTSSSSSSCYEHRMDFR